MDQGSLAHLLLGAVFVSSGQGGVDHGRLITGAARGIGLALAKDALRRGWHVIGSVREICRAIT
jgi:hypothetical protein